MIMGLTWQEKNKGVKAHLLEKNSLSIFSPCACHTLGLILHIHVKKSNYSLDVSKTV